MNEKLNIVNKKLSDFSIYNNGTWQSEKEITTNYCPDLGMGCPYQGPTDCDIGKRAMSVPTLGIPGRH